MPVSADCESSSASSSILSGKVGESRHFVSRQSVADMGPTLVWLKSVVPVLERTGKVELRVSQTPDGGEATQLFTKTVDYAL